MNACVPVTQFKEKAITTEIFQVSFPNPIPVPPYTPL